MTAAAKPPTILVVDDDPDCRHIAACLLEQQGYRACRAASGAECLETVRRQPVDLILLDVMMPGMDGFEVAAALRADPASRSIPVILLTARDDVDTRLEGIYHGVSEYLTKPINRHELHARVRAQLHIRELSRQLEAVERRLEQAGGPPIPPTGTGRG